MVEDGNQEERMGKLMVWLQRREPLVWLRSWREPMFWLWRRRQLLVLLETSFVV